MNNLNKNITIVLDPEHGATYNKWNTVDSGALGSNGKNEKFIQEFAKGIDTYIQSSE